MSLANRQAAGELIGRTIGGRYRLVELLGVGATAAVFRAEQDGEPSPVALKLSHAGLIGRPTRVARFQREIRAIRRMDHPGCTRLLDWGIEGDRGYIAMDLAGGEDLEDVLGRMGRLPEERATAIALAVCDVLVAAHERGIVHRDLKPRNIKLVPGDGGEPHVKVLDFGLAKLFRISDGDETHAETLTRPGATLGTPGYMAPEQLRSAEVDARADVYALGAILYRMLAGRAPFEGRTTTVLLELATKPPRPLSELAAGVHPTLAQVVMRCLEKDPALRWPTAVALGDALRAARACLDEDDDIRPTAVVDWSDERAELLAKKLNLQRHELLPRLHQDSSSGESDPTQVWHPEAPARLVSPKRRDDAISVRPPSRKRRSSLGRASDLGKRTLARWRRSQPFAYHFILSFGIGFVLAALAWWALG